MLVSVIIRTLNEQRYLPELLQKLDVQISDCFAQETIIVDSGSTDETLDIARQFGCKITTIAKQDFSFGRSLNIGCSFASGDVLVFISGHCIPTSNDWLHNLCAPLADGKASYTYGQQIGRDTTKFSESQVLQKYFPRESNIPQDSDFCNNANAALLRSVWEKFHFNEVITGLEDMYLAKQIRNAKLGVGYVGSRATVFHIHNESWIQTVSRYEREAIALQQINPNIHISAYNFIHFYLSSVALDINKAIKERRLLKELKGIVLFRLAQYWGSYKGNRMKRILDSTETRKYYYPSSSD